MSFFCYLFFFLLLYLQLLLQCNRFFFYSEKPKTLSHGIQVLSDLHIKYWHPFIQSQGLLNFMPVCLLVKDALQVHVSAFFFPLVLQQTLQSPVYLGEKKINYSSLIIYHILVSWRQNMCILALRRIVSSMDHSFDHILNDCLLSVGIPYSLRLGTFG